ncbi:mite allergen Eur m 3-like [Schistocerca cancellata]|uniref:mite allergen Eur m 3-like n=1 Tax=Schistocerca cancellata TaxID=274614 RepID=UPI0021191AAE|nr:mite allergen Eur m 3-like [Schistocerca cancellata]
MVATVPSGGSTCTQVYLLGPAFPMAMDGEEAGVPPPYGNYQGPSTDDLQKEDLHKWNQEVCASIWGDLGYAIYSSQICAARFEDVNYGTCHGDSGGPVLHGGVLQGLTSWGYECATPPYPGIYTRVASYVDWIHRHTGTSSAPNWRH